MWRRIIIFLVVLLAYPVLGTVILSTGVVERLVGSEDLKVELKKPAWTLWPGHFHVAGARILVNGATQFKLEANNLVIQLQLFPLIKHHLHVTSLKGDGIRYWMRTQVKDPKGIEKRLAAYPVLDDLPGDPTLIEKKAEKTEPRQADFTVEVDGIDVHIVELWFMEYHYLGPGTLKGSFLVGPKRMRVGTSVQGLGPGQLRFGATEPLINGFGGRIQAAIPDVDPEEHANGSFLELVTSEIQLSGDIVSLAPLSAYTKSIRLIDGAGPLDTRLILSKGKLSDNSKFDYSTKKVGIRTEGLGVDTDWNFEAHVDGLPRAHAAADVTYVSAANRQGKIFTVQLQKNSHDVVLNSTQLGKMTDIDHASIRFPTIVTTDIHDLAALTGDAAFAESKSGEAHASLNVDVDSHHIARGAFKSSFEGLQFSAADIHVSGQGRMNGKLHADLDHKIASVRDVNIALRDVGLRAGDEEVSGWWMNADIPFFGVWGVPPTREEARLSLRARNAAPLLKTLAAKDEISSLIPKLTSLPDLRVRATFRKDRDVTDVVMEPVENNLFDVAGRFYSKQDQSHFAFVVGGKAVSLGIAKRTGAGVSLMPFAREGWLNEQLRSFPKPVQQINTSEP